MNIYSDPTKNAHTATDETIADIHQLAQAAELIAFDYFSEKKPEQGALRGVIDALLRRFADTDDLRDAEWKATGGKSMKEFPKVERPEKPADESRLGWGPAGEEITSLNAAPRFGGASPFPGLGVAAAPAEVRRSAT